MSLCIPTGATETITDLKRLHEASYVMVKMPDGRQLSFDGRPMDIVLDIGTYVWVAASYADNLPEGAVQVGDGRSSGYTQDGNRIISVPADWCTFYTDAEAEGIHMAMDADEQLLSYAR